MDWRGASGRFGNQRADALLVWPVEGHIGGVAHIFFWPQLSHLLDIRGALAIVGAFFVAWDCMHRISFVIDTWT
jgi:hypothetical protein